MGSLFEFTVVHDGTENILEARKGEYRNLMVLLKDRICPDDFGQCGGMGRCGTCLVKLSGVEETRMLSYRNEQTTLNKMGIEDPAIQLSCGIAVDEDLKNITVELLDNI